MYYGRLKTKKQADSLIKKLEENYKGKDNRVNGMISMLKHNWHAIAARPALQLEIYVAAETTPLWRKGGIADIIKNGQGKTK